jgi:hypothetical protein
VLAVAVIVAGLFALAGGTIEFDAWVGSDDDSAESVSTAVITTPTPNNPATNTARVEAEDIQFEYPSDWTVYALTTEDVEEQRAALAKKNPQLAAALDANTFVGLTKFFAADLGAGFRGEFVSNVGVVAQGSAGFPSNLGDFEQGAHEIAATVGGTLLGVSQTKLNGTTAYRADLTVPVKLPDGGQITVRQAHLFTPLRGGASDLVVTSLNDDRGVAIIDSVLNSVRRI